MKHSIKDKKILQMYIFVSLEIKQSSEWPQFLQHNSKLTGGFALVSCLYVEGVALHCPHPNIAVS